MSRSHNFQKALADLVCDEIHSSDGNEIVMAKIAGELATAIGHTISMLSAGDKEKMQVICMQLEDRVFKAALMNSEFAKGFFK